MIVKRKIGDITSFDKDTTKRLRIAASSYYAPKDPKLKPKGEDAHFISKETQTVGVADGVGGWAQIGIDSGKYSRKLMKNSLTALKSEPNGAVDPMGVLQRAFDDTKVEGSSTACILTLRGNKLRFANVGDSGFMVFRGKRCVYTSPTQQRRFNCPFQLGNGPTADSPSSAYVGEFNAEAGDVVLGTDGLLDNVYPWEIEEILSLIEGRTWPEIVASWIGSVAMANSFDGEYESPFTFAAVSAGFNYCGGKHDDITVVVACIESLE